MQKAFHRSIVLPLVAFAAAAIVPAAGLADDAVKMGYINKMGEHPWFVAEVGGAKSKASQLGVNLMTQDVQFNADLALTTFDTMVGDGVKGIAIVVPDKALGPVVAEKAAKAGIKLIAVDDDIYTADKKMIPYIGMNAEEIGKQVGAEEARLYKAMGWDKFNDVRIGSVEDHCGNACPAARSAAWSSAAPAIGNRPISDPSAGLMIGRKPESVRSCQRPSISSSSAGYSTGTSLQMILHIESERPRPRRNLAGILR